MALVLKDRVKETTTTTGTGAVTLGGAPSGFQSFSVIGNANTTYYAIVDPASGDWEVGIGTYTASGTTLSRDTILESSSGGTAISFGAGAKDVFVTYPAEYAAVSSNGLGTTGQALVSNGGSAAASFQTLSAADVGALPITGGTVTGPTVVEMSSASTALRVTQTGTGDAFVVEDAANPDATPFVISAAGRVGIGTPAPSLPLEVNGSGYFSANLFVDGLVSVGSTVESTLGGFIFPDATTQTTAASALTVKDEGTTLTSAAASLNFTGAGVTATNTGNDVTVAITSGGISSADIQEFTTAGTSTWTKPAGAKIVYVLMFSGGGGGGSGRRRNAGDVALAGGGTGGAAGGRIEAWIPAVSLGATESVVVGAGGTGGASQTVDNTNGALGGSGTASTFSFFRARAATQGGGGGTSTGAGAGGSSGGTNTPATQFAATLYTAAGASGSSGAAAATAAGRGGVQAGGGGGGGGIATNGTTTYAPSEGGLGGAVFATTTGLTGGGGAAGTSGATATSGTAGAAASTYVVGGSGGGGGGAASAGISGSGATGGYPGGGGGGGGSSNSGFNSGAGGNGGDGYVRIVTFF